MFTKNKILSASKISPSKTFTNLFELFTRFHYITFIEPASSRSNIPSSAIPDFLLSASEEGPQSLCTQNQTRQKKFKTIHYKNSFQRILPFDTIRKQNNHDVRTQRCTDLEIRADTNSEQVEVAFLKLAVRRLKGRLKNDLSQSAAPWAIDGESAGLAELRAGRALRCCRVAVLIGQGCFLEKSYFKNVPFFIAMLFVTTIFLVLGCKCIR